MEVPGSYHRAMPFPCPVCAAPVELNLEAWLRRCPSCGAWLRSRPVEAGGAARTYDVEAVGRPETRRRVEVPWQPRDARRLRRWLLWSSLLTLGLVVVLYALARMLTA
jgi:hypothetical protein